MGQRRSPLGVVDLERVCARGWPGLETGRLGDWELRAGGGFTGRANSVLVVGDPGCPPAAAVDTVTAWYAGRGLVPAAQLPGRQARPADTAFAAAGWARDEDTLVLTAPLQPGPPPTVPVELSGRPDGAWLAAYRHRDGPLPAVAGQVLTRGADEVVFASVEHDAAVARGVVTDGWLGVAALTVAEPLRRTGLGTAVMAALRDWGLRRGAHSGYLQVAASNAPALAMYRRAGYIEHHRYHYRRSPG